MLVTMQLLWMYLQPLKVILRSHELLCSVTFCTSFPTCILSAYSQGVAAVIIGSGPDVSFNGANEVPYMTFVYFVTGKFLCRGISQSPSRSALWVLARLSQSLTRFGV